MTRTHPPRLATWLLKRFGFSRYTQAILGDLTECYRRRQSTIWYWKQVASAIIGSCWRGVRGYLDQLNSGSADWQCGPRSRCFEQPSYSFPVAMRPEAVHPECCCAAAFRTDDDAS